MIVPARILDRSVPTVGFRHDEGEQMGIEDIANQAKDLAGQHADKVGEVIDQAAEKAKAVAPDQADGMVDQAAQAAKDAISGQ